MDVLASGMIVAVASVFMAAGVWSGKGYEAISIPDGSTKLVDEAGKIVAGQTVTDADGNEWTTDDKGAITKNGSQDRRTAFAPSVRAWQKGDDRD